MFDYLLSINRCYYFCYLLFVFCYLLYVTFYLLFVIISTGICRQININFYSVKSCKNYWFIPVTSKPICR